MKTVGSTAVKEVISAQLYATGFYDLRNRPESELFAQNAGI